MTPLEITLAWIIVQVTLALPPAVALHLLASRRGPATGSWTAAAGLVMIVAITVIPLVPRPRSWDHVQTRDAARVAIDSAPDTSLAVIDEGKRGTTQKPEASGFVPGLWLERYRMFMGSLGTHAEMPLSSSFRWTRFLAFALIAGVAISLCRLPAALIAIRECVRRGRVIVDPELVDRLKALQHAMGVRRTIDIIDLALLHGVRRQGVAGPRARLWQRQDARFSERGQTHNYERTYCSSSGV
jgi:hypothetical protein